MLTCPYCHARSFASPKAMSCHILASVSCPQHLIQLAPLLSCSCGFVNRVTDSTSEILTRESHRSGRLLTTNANRLMSFLMIFWQWNIPNIPLIGLLSQVTYLCYLPTCVIGKTTMYVLIPIFVCNDVTIPIILSLRKLNSFWWVTYIFLRILNPKCFHGHLLFLILNG